jgi:predicted DNA-binding antitoxin AbrB/MazE fold protein
MVSVNAIYENGVFRPLSPVELPEGARVEVLIPPTTAEPPEHDASGAAATLEEAGADSPGQRAFRLLMEIAALPHTSPDERTDIGERHDEILYPKHGPMP